MLKRVCLFGFCWGEGLAGTDGRIGYSDGVAGSIWALEELGCVDEGLKLTCPGGFLGMSDQGDLV